MHNKPECLRVFHEKCFLDFQRMYSACPACKPEYDLKQLRLADELLMHEIKGAADIAAEIDHFITYSHTVYKDANDFDRYIMYEAFSNFEDSLLLDDEAPATKPLAD